VFAVPAIVELIDILLIVTTDVVLIS